MGYDTEFWNKYADENETNYNEEFAKFVRDLAVSLRATNVLEVGCNTGNDLKMFSENIEVHGIDLNDHALEIATKKLPSFKFKKGSITDIPFDDSAFDFVFTHNVLNYVEQEDIQKALKELYRVSRKYILNCELFDEAEGQVSDVGTPAWKRNVYSRWLNFKVKIISNIDMHEEIEPEKPRFTLVRKIE